ncbi:preprotein translocase subunit SecG [bacterium]|jgi:protein translocase SecG subunit|nr:preprotein translocase subunit SecG [bacterium]MBT5015042.1 preprotein translocase subunit SecG [bacterium]
MLYGLLATLFVFCSVLIVFLVLLQKGKGGMGLGAMGGGQQQLFGGSGGQDIFQKATWILGAAIMIGSFSLALYRSKYVPHQFSTNTYQAPASQRPASTPNA